MTGFGKLCAVVGLISSLISILAFVTGWDSLREAFRETTVAVEQTIKSAEPKDVVRSQHDPAAGDPAVGQSNDHNRPVSDVRGDQEIASDSSPVLAPKDHPVLTGLKAIPVLYVLVFGIMVAIVTFTIDVAANASGFTVSLTPSVWDVVWNKVTVTWYWDRSTDWGIVLSFVFVLVLCGFVKFIED